MNFCNQCGFKLLPGSQFCSQCGAKVSFVATPNNPPIEPPMTNYEPLLVFQATEQKGLKFNYVFIVIYQNRVLISITPSKQMEKQIYAAMKEEKKRRKMSLLEQTGYRKNYFDQIIQNFKRMSDQEFLSCGPLNMVLPAYQINQCRIVFQKVSVYHGADDSSSSKRQGKIEFHIGNMKYKYTHGYVYDQTTVNQLSSVFQNKFKFIK